MIRVLETVFRFLFADVCRRLVVYLLLWRFVLRLVPLIRFYYLRPFLFFDVPFTLDEETLSVPLLPLFSGRIIFDLSPFPLFLLRRDFLSDEDETVGLSLNPVFLFPDGRLLLPCRGVLP